MNDIYLPGTGFGQKPKDIYSNVPVPVYLKLISLITFLQIFYVVKDSFLDKTSLFIQIVGFVLSILIIVTSTALWRGTKWAREVAIFFYALFSVDFLGDVYQFFFHAIRGEYDLVYQLTFIFRLALSVFVVIYLWQIRKVNYGLTKVSYDYEKTTIPENINPEVQKIIDKGEQVLKIKKRKSILSFIPLIFLALNSPLIIMSLGVVLLTKEAPALFFFWGFLFYIYLFIVSASIPFVIWSLVSETRQAKIISLIFSAIFLLPGIFLMLFSLFVKLLIMLRS